MRANGDGWILSGWQQARTQCNSNKFAKFLLAHLRNKNIFYMQIYISVGADGRLSTPYWFLFPLNLQMVESSQLPLHIYQKTGRHTAASCKSCYCICRIWLSHRDMIYIAFCRQSIGRWLYDSCPLLQCCTFGLILLLLGTWKCSCWGQIGNKTRGNTTSFTSEEIISPPSVSWDEIKMVSDKVRKQI